MSGGVYFAGSGSDGTIISCSNQKEKGGVMGSIELQLVAFIMVFSGSGSVVPLLDLAFPVFTTGYLVILSRLAFPCHATCSSSSTSAAAAAATGSSRLSSSYHVIIIIGTTIGLFLPLAYVLGGFARGDEHSVESATPHLFLVSCQILTENIVSRLPSLFSHPVRALVPVLYTVRRIFLILDWVQDVWIIKSSLSPPPAAAEIKDVAWFWFGRLLALANLAYFSIYLFGFLIPRFLPDAFNQYFTQDQEKLNNEIQRNKVEDKLQQHSPTDQQDNIIKSN